MRVLNQEAGGNNLAKNQMADGRSRSLLHTKASLDPAARPVCPFAWRRRAITPTVDVLWQSWTGDPLPTEYSLDLLRLDRVRIGDWHCLFRRAPP